MTNPSSLNKSYWAGVSSKPTDRKLAVKPLVKPAASAQPRLRVLAGPQLFLLAIS